jgi:inner membrane protein
MASIGHLAVGVAAARRLTLRERGGLFGPMVALSALSLLPDLDVIGFTLGVPYGSPIGHRGASHSLAVAVFAGLAAAAVTYASCARAVPEATRRLHRAVRLGTYVACVVASHGLLDSMTDGGKGVALLWPFTDQRFFLGWRPIPVAPIGARFFSSRGLRVATFELIEFAPLFAYAIFARRRASPAVTLRRADHDDG